MKRTLSILLSIILVFSVTEAAYAAEIVRHDTDPSEWTDIVKAIDYYYALHGIRADGTVVSHPVKGPYTEVEKCVSICREIRNWENIQDMVAVNDCCCGLKKDGTVVSTRDIGLSSWNHITQIAGGEFWLAGLREDGTVVVTDKNAVAEFDCGWEEEEWLDVSEWNNIIEIFPHNGWTVQNGLIGLKSDGTLLITHTGSSFGEYTFDWDDIASVCSTLTYVYGLKSDGTVAAPSWLEDMGVVNNFPFLLGEHGCLGTPPSEWRNVLSLAGGYQDDIYAVNKDGSVSALIYHEFEEELYQEIREWTDIKALYPGFNYVIGVTESGQVRSAGIRELKNGEQVDFAELSEWENIKDIVVGYGYIAGLTNDGTVEIYYLPLD